MDSTPHVDLFHKMFSPINDRKISEASKEDMEFINKSSKNHKIFTDKTVKDTSKK